MVCLVLGFFVRLMLVSGGAFVLFVVGIATWMWVFRY